MPPEEIDSLYVALMAYEALQMEGLVTDSHNPLVGRDTLIAMRALTTGAEDAQVVASAEQHRVLVVESWPSVHQAAFAANALREASHKRVRSSHLP